MQKAPVFALPDKDGKVRALTDISSPWVVLYFYPRDNTPGCTLEAVEFSGTLDAFRKAGAEVIGISGGDMKSKQKFCSKHKLSVRLLSDADHTVAKAYGVYGEKQFMGKKVMGIKRSTFILDKQRKIVRQFRNVKAEGHAEAVLAEIRALAGAKSQKLDSRREPSPTGSGSARRRAQGRGRGRSGR